MIVDSQNMADWIKKAIATRNWRRFMPMKRYTDDFYIEHMKKADKNLELIEPKHMYGDATYEQVQEEYFSTIDKKEQNLFYLTKKEHEEYLELLNFDNTFVPRKQNNAYLIRAERDLVSRISWDHIKYLIFARDEYKCQRCSRISEEAEGLEVHHLFPQYLGGLDIPSNLETRCWICHNPLMLEHALKQLAKENPIAQLILNEMDKYNELFNSVNNVDKVKKKQ